MKKTFLAATVLSLFTLVGCNQNTGYEGPTATATFYLEGGVCKTNTEKVDYIYRMDGITETFIADPRVLDAKDITKANFTLECWYQVRTGSEGNYSYSDPWDFEKDKMGLKGVVLYAGWAPNLIYSYDMYYRDEKTDNDVLINSYEVKEGDKFDDYLRLADKREGYTSIGFFDADGNPWDSSFVHPGGKTDTSVKVYVKYIEGDYEVVKTASELKRAVGKNIYLANDIDLEGSTLNFGNYKKTFLGNGYKIRNFTIGYVTTSTGQSGQLYLGVFHTLENATIKDVSFENVEFVLENSNSRVHNIYLGTIAGSTVNSVVENVKFSGSYTISSKTTRPVEWNLTDPSFQTDETSTFTDCVVTCQVTDKRTSVANVSDDTLHIDFRKKGV